MMDLHGVRRCCVVLTLLLACLGAAWPQSSTEHVVQAADRFLTTLTEAQRQKVVFSYGDATQRARWSNFPTGFVPRAGIRLKDMNATQRAAAMDILKTVLSPMGFEKVTRSV